MKTLVRYCLLGYLLTAATTASAMEGDYTVTAGRGLKAVYIGQEAASAAQSLGTPKEALYGFIYLYDLPDGTKLNYRLADKRIESVSFAGSSLSRYQTSRGGKFGMTRAQVEALYGKPDAEAANKIFYNRLGIGFFFKAGSVSEFWVFPPY
jgi:hypothetical protein